MSHVHLDPSHVQTNIVLFDVASAGMDSHSFAKRLATEGVLVMPFGPTTIRAVTHMDVTAADIDRALEIIAQFVKSSGK